MIQGQDPKDRSSTFDSAHQRSSNESNASPQLDFQKLPKSLQKLEKFINNIEQSMHLIGTKSDTPEFRKTSRQNRDTAREICNVIGNFFRSNESQLKVDPSLRKLQKDFLKLVSRLDEILNESLRKEKAISVALSASIRSGSFSMESRSSVQALEQMGLQFQDLGDINERLERERLEGVRQLAEEIQGIHEIFSRVGEIVEKQGQQIDQIHENINQAHIDVEAGTEHLVKTNEYQRSIRKTQLICFGGIAVTITVVIIVLVLVVFKR